MACTVIQFPRRPRVKAQADPAPTGGTGEIALFVIGLLTGFAGAIIMGVL